MHGHHLGESLDQLQEKLTADYTRLQRVSENDDLWMDLAEIEADSNFRATLNAYKSRRPYEELLSIDGASNGNVINKTSDGTEIIMGWLAWLSADEYPLYSPAQKPFLPLAMYSTPYPPCQ